MKDPIKAIEELAETIAQVRVDAAFAAAAAINVSFLDLMVKKGVLSKSDIEQTLAKLEQHASKPSPQPLLVNEFVLRYALTTRHAFGLAGRGSSN